MKSKANQQDLLKLDQDKTNKVDCEAQMIFIESLHSMVDAVAVLLHKVATILNSNNEYKQLVIHAG